MKITFNDLRRIKHQLPTGSIKRIAKELEINEQTVRNYFGAKKYPTTKQIIGKHIQPGPNGGIVHLQRTDIIESARRLIKQRMAEMI